ncbi:MAG: ABC transporter permease [Bacteroidota bacterium]
MKPNVHKPPRLAQKFLNWFLRSDLAEEVQGDLDEKFYSVLHKKSLSRARWNYWYQVFHYLRPFALRKRSLRNINQYAMLENYFKIGWRNMSRQKMYSSIKVGGFALGIAACLLISLFIRHELSYDKNYRRGNRIYRVVEIYNNKGKIQKGIHLPAPLGPAIKEDYAEIEQVARLNPVELFGAGSNDIRRDGQLENTHEAGFVYADPEFLQMLDLPFIYGDAAHALAEPNTIVITKRKADKYFPNEDPLGKVMIVNNDESRPYKVGGVMADLPDNLHFQYDFFITLSGREFYQGEQTNWLASNYPTYILVQPGTNPAELSDKLKAVGVKYYLPIMKEAGVANIEEEVKNLSYRLQPIDEIYFNAEQIRDGFNHGDARFTWMSGAIAVFILIIACINFINLSTAKSANRAKEVGLRKVVGCFRGNLVSQFLIESLLFSFFSFVIGLLLAALLFPFFSSALVGKTMTFPWNEWWLLPLMGAGALLVGLVAGIYPSFYLSSFRPIEVLKGRLALGSKSGYMRSFLVVFQFTTSIVLIIGTFIIYRQMQHVLTTKVGFEKDQVVLIQGTNLLGDKLGTFKEELLRQRDIKHVTVSDYLPIRGTKRNGNGFWNEGRKELDQGVGTQFWKVDHDYIKTLGIKIVDGRDFSRDIPSDSDAVVINQAMAKELNLKDPVGKRVYNYKNWNVIGVMENFNFESLKEDVRPLCMVLGNSPSITAVKVNTADMPAVLGIIDGVWRKFAPQQTIRYTFLDESYARMYEDVRRMGKVFTSFSILAIIVASLGLFGLSSFMVEQRSKEISIRLVLGASVNNIFRMLTQNFVKLIMISFVLAAPLGWLMMQKWLESYVNKTPIGPDIFLYAGLIAVIIALLTISYQAIRAAFLKPVDVLRSE